MIAIAYLSEIAQILPNFNNIFKNFLGCWTLIDHIFNLSRAHDRDFSPNMGCNKRCL